ncbi:MAG: ABC transporter permease, partial [Treponemataceae bacterium]|nr:ABC transporter permease [Treponemataceae bacterium]
MSGKQGKINQGVLYAWPMGIWLVVFFIAPLAIILIYSFLTKGLYGSVIAEFSLKAFKEMANPKYAVIVLRTIKISIIATTITILVALPCGYAIARSRHQTLLLLLVIIPFWTNSLIRIFAWISILNKNGIINQLLMNL